jgi:hypothetical protein
VRFSVFSVLIIVVLTAILVSGQEKLSPEDQTKLSAADKLAARFVERFRQTRDFGTVWKEFRVRDTRCAIRLAPVLGSFSSNDLKEKSFEQRLLEKGLDDEILDRLYISIWNSSLLYQGYYYSLARSRNGSEPSEDLPKPKSRASKRLFKLISNLEKEGDKGTKEPQTRKDFERIIANAIYIGQQFRKYMSDAFLKSKNWKSAVHWFSDVHGVGGQVIDRERFADRCSAGKGPLYISQIGFFVFCFSEENGQLRLWSMSFIDD